MVKSNQDIRPKIAILGSGLPGSVMALVLSKLGFDVVVIDKNSHPRFTIGESSTPTTDLYLAQIADEFEIPELKPLSRYGSTKKNYPNLDVGLKRGFSYFHHLPNSQFVPNSNHSNELIVAASASDELSDSNWRRQDIDAFAVSCFENYKIEFLDRCTILNIAERQDQWQIELDRLGKKSKRQVNYFIDATGKAAVGIQSQNGTSIVDELKTNTNAVFAHFQGLIPWSKFFDANQSKDHPFCCDNAAVHQVLGSSWMWQLPFDSGITSCGVVSSNCNESTFLRHLDDNKENLKYFFEQVENFPSLREQFRNACAVAPTNGAIGIQRLQHFFNIGSGKNWCALPNTIGFVDPLHSKGLAHALSGVYRMAKKFASLKSFPANTFASESFDSEITGLTQQFADEIRFLDSLISICYLTLNDFKKFCLSTFWYFAAATCFERQIHESNRMDSPFLFSNNQEFRRRLFVYESLVSTPCKSSVSSEELVQRTKNLLDPFDHVGLFRPTVHNMYNRTAAPGKS